MRRRPLGVLVLLACADGIASTAATVECQRAIARALLDRRSGEPAPTLASFTCDASVSTTFEGEITASIRSATALTLTP